ncbi:MAG: type II secretion system protein, partial [Candidatus Vogelbacteria bacterium]|nr:type II secretion system protein [Candidatus Vogelbacteria bacterium]
SGFTLIELLVVISIIALLSSIVFASFAEARMKARNARRIVELREIQKAIELYRADHGVYPADPTPDSDHYASSGVDDVSGISCWDCPYTAIIGAAWRDQNDNEESRLLSGQWYDPAYRCCRLASTTPYLSVRPNTSRRELRINWDTNDLCNLDGCTNLYAGIYYKVNPSGTEYKLAYLGLEISPGQFTASQPIVEPGEVGIPAGLWDIYFVPNSNPHAESPPANSYFATISVSSSDKAASWYFDCLFYHYGAPGGPTPAFESNYPTDRYCAE